MRTSARIAMMVCLAAWAAPLWAAPCSTSAPGNTALEKAANGLGQGQWCEMTPAMLNFTQNATKVKDVLDSCASSSLVNTYAMSMAYDPTQGTAGKIWWWGTAHGGSYRGFIYDLAANQFTAMNTINGQCNTPGTCQTDFESSPIPYCKGCNADHAYSGVTDDNNGSFYRVRHNGSLWKVNLPSGVNQNWKSCNGQGAGTGAMDFWPNHGSAGTLVAMCGIDHEEVALLDLSSGSWSAPFPLLNWGSNASGGSHNVVRTNHGSGEVWLTEGIGGPFPNGKRSWRLRSVGGNPVLTEQSPAPVLLALTRTAIVDDPVDPAGKFIVWSMNGDGVGTGNAGWWEYNMGTDTWTSFAALGVASMPPLYSNPSNLSDTGSLSVSIPEYGVAVWLSYKDDEGSDLGGMFLYKHTTATGGGEVEVPLPPAIHDPS